MTDQEKILVLEIKVNNLEIQVNRLMNLMEQQYTITEMLTDNQQLIANRLTDMDRSVRSNEQYIAGQLDRNSGR